MPDTPTSENYLTSNTRWSAAQSSFADWSLSGVTLTSSGTLQLNPAHATRATDPHPTGEYNGRSFYNGADFYVGEATSPTTHAPFNFAEAIISWNADTPEGSWIEALLRVRIGERWTGWYNMGVWAASCTTVERHSVHDQQDADADVFTDNLVLNDAGEANAYEVKLRLFSADGDALPSLLGAALAISTRPRRPTSLLKGNPALWGKCLRVPQCSQMVYPDGGNVWCSAVSMSMVLAYWSGDLNSPCEERVRRTVEGVYDWLYEGHGNWPFNAAYAATHGLEGYVARFTSFAQAEPFIAEGVPVIISYAWGEGDLTGAAVSSSDGHLGVLVGFDPAGDPIVNDPAAAEDSAVRR
ncbi:MAG TPA: C39 family peptidase, partial [Chloroflexia bacterium]|nr:C39 family peptidase [Chloroflexia bacterium]